MFFKYWISSGVEVDLTDQVDVVQSLSVRRIDTWAGGGIGHPSLVIGQALTEGFELTAEGTLFAEDFASLRSKVASLLRYSKGYLMLESDRRVPALLTECRITDWQHGLSLARLSLQFVCAGYAESVTTSYGTAQSGGWAVSNTGDLPAPVKVSMTLQSAQSSQDITFAGGISPSGSSRTLKLVGAVSTGGTVYWDSGVDGLEARIDSNANVIRSGYPFFVATGNSTVTYSLTPSNTVTAATLEFRRRWLFL